MKVTMKPLETVELLVDGESLGEFKMVSHWEGMTKLTSSKGDIIINNPKDPISTLFKGVFDGNESTEHQVIIASACFGPILNKSVDEK